MRKTCPLLRGETYDYSNTFLLVTLRCSHWLRLDRNTEYWISIPTRWLRYGDLWYHSLRIQGILGVPGWLRCAPSTYSRSAISWVSIAHMHCYIKWAVIRVFPWHNQWRLLSSQLLHVGNLLLLHYLAGWSLAASSGSS